MTQVQILSIRILVQAIQDYYCPRSLRHCEYIRTMASNFLFPQTERDKTDLEMICYKARISAGLIPRMVELSKTRLTELERLAFALHYQGPDAQDMGYIENTGESALESTTEQING
jgi:hypothetical protein